MGRVFDSLEDVDLSGTKLTDPLPLGPTGVLHGKLDNGLTYYVRKCSKPKDRVAVGLAVRVGSVVEADTEQGLAHVVEHLAFNATEKYDNHEIVRFLERIGAEFGACQNAYTSCDETVYQLTIPCDTPTLLGEAIAVLAQFAFHIRCADGDLAKERGAVMEEARMTRDAAGRMQEAHWKLILEGSKYADRLPIGKEHIIKHASADTVRGFYERWYHPQHMAVVVVGDFQDSGAVVDLLQQHLAHGRSRSLAPPPPIPHYSFAPHATARYGVMVDKETQHASVYVSFKHPRRTVSTPKEFLEHLEDGVFQTALSTRFFKLWREINPPFIQAAVSDEPVTTTIESHVLSATALEGSVLRALETLLTEVARVRVHGFSPREVERAKREMMVDIENTYLERDQAYSSDVRDEYVRHFLNGEFVTGQELEARLSKTLLPRITSDSITARATLYAPHCNCVVKVVSHRKGVSEEQLKEVVARVAAAEASGSLGQWEENESPDSLMPSEPHPKGSIVSERTFPQIGATELTLSNGMRVCFKATDFMDDECMVTGTAHGGLSEIPRELFFTSSTSGAFAGQLGLFGFKPTVAGDILSGKRVQLDVSEGAYSRSFQGVQSPTDMVEAMQLIHLLFVTDVKFHEEEIKNTLSIMRQGIQANLRNPTYTWGHRVREINYGGCYYFAPMTLEAFDALDPYLALAHHNLNYHNPAEFTVVFTGKIDREQLIPLIETYLATIPPSNLPPPRDPKTITPLPFSFPAQPVIEDVEAPMISPITQTQITFPVTLSRPTAREQLVWLSMCCKALETRLLQKLRFQFGEVYTVSVSPVFGCEAPSNPGDLQGDVGISFTCDPANKARLIAMALEEVATLQATGPTAAEVETMLTLERLSYENSLAENSHWHEVMVMGYMSKSYQDCKDLDVVYSRTEMARSKVLGAISPETVRDAMQRLFPHPPTSRYTAITLMPQPPSIFRRALSVVNPFRARSSSSGVKAASQAGTESRGFGGSSMLLWVGAAAAVAAVSLVCLRACKRLQSERGSA